MLMQVLDLTSNKIAAVSSIEPLLGLSSLQHVTLLSNPVAASSAAFTKTFSNVSAAFFSLKPQQRVLKCTASV